MKKVISILLFFFICLQLFANPFEERVFLENSFWGISNLCERKYGFTNSEFKILNRKKKKATSYPYTYDSNYIKLENPRKIEPTIGSNYANQRIKYTLTDHNLVLIFEDGTTLNLIEESYVRRVADITAGALLAIGSTCLIADSISGKLVSNQSYTSNGYEYKTDKYGRITEALGNLRLEEGTRNTEAQKIVGGADRLASDDGGHLIANRFGGSGGLDNLVPMNSNINRGAYKRLENRWANALELGKNVRVKVNPIYKGDSSRPSSFEITEWIDGVKAVYNFSN